MPGTRFLALFLAMAPLTLTACADEPREEAPAPVETAPVYPAADGGTASGRFEISSADSGAVIVQEVLGDGTYRNIQDGEIVETGTWETPERGLFCTSSNGQTSCDEESIAPDGTWISVNVEDAAVRWIVRRLEETSEPPAA